MFYLIFCVIGESLASFHLLEEFLKLFQNSVFRVFITNYFYIKKSAMIESFSGILLFLRIFIISLIFYLSGGAKIANWIWVSWKHILFCSFFHLSSNLKYIRPGHERGSHWLGKCTLPLRKVVPVVEGGGGELTLGATW